MEGIVVNVSGDGGLNPDIIVQEPGQSPVKVMSQKAATDLVEQLAAGTFTLLEVPVEASVQQYTGEVLSPLWYGYDPVHMVIDGAVTATDAGTYTCQFTPTEDALWSDRTHYAKKVLWHIAKGICTCTLSEAQVSINKGSSQTVDIMRSGNGTITITSDHPEIASAVLEGDDRIRVIGMQPGKATVTVMVAESDNYQGADAFFDVTVMQAIEIPMVAGTLMYDGTEQAPSWHGYDPDGGSLHVSGDLTAVNAGTYTTVFVPADDFCWLDGTKTPQPLKWTIAQAPGLCSLSLNALTVTTASSGRVDFERLDNAAVTAVSEDTAIAVASVQNNAIVVSGKAKGTTNIKVTAEQTINYAAASALLRVTVNQVLSVPVQSGTVTWNGASQTPSWSNYSSTALAIAGSTSATNAGTYTVTFTPKSGYCWSDGSTSAKSVNWTIGRAAISVPLQSGTLTYTGSSQSPRWSSTSYMTTSGTTSATNAGTYTATFTPDNNHKWSDGSTSAKSVSWSISKATGTCALSATSASLSIGGSQNIAVTRKDNAPISVSTSNSGVATSSVSGSTVTITAKGNGTSTITISAAATTNYTAASATVAVTVMTIVSLPYQNGTLTYTGSAQSPSWYGYNSAQLSISGTNSATNAGTYTVMFTPKTGYCWSDGTTAGKSVSWVIGKMAAGQSGITFSFSAQIYNNVYSWPSKQDTCTFTVNGTGNRTIQATLLTDAVKSYCTISVSGNVVSVTERFVGFVFTIAIKVASDENHEEETFELTCQRLQYYG